MNHIYSDCDFVSARGAVCNTPSFSEKSNLNHTPQLPEECSNLPYFCFVFEQCTQQII